MSFCAVFQTASISNQHPFYYSAYNILSSDFILSIKYLLIDFSVNKSIFIPITSVSSRSILDNSNRDFFPLKLTIKSISDLSVFPS